MSAESEKAKAVPGSVDSAPTQHKAVNEIPRKAPLDVAGKVGPSDTKQAPKAGSAVPWGPKPKLQIKPEAKSVPALKTEPSISDTNVSTVTVTEAKPTPQPVTDIKPVVKSAAEVSSNLASSEVKLIPKQTSAEIVNVNKCDNKTDSKPTGKPTQPSQPSQGSSSNSDLGDEKSPAGLKSENVSSDDKAKGPKTFDKETFVEAPIPATNPWKKPAPPEPAKPAVTEKPSNETKKPLSEAHSDKRKPVTSGYQRGGPPPRSPRGAKYSHYHHNRNHPSVPNKADQKLHHDRSRKPLVASKSTPAASDSSSTLLVQQG